VSNLDPLRHLQHITEVALVILAGLLLLGVYGVTLLVVRRTLDPVGAMAQQATRWSETDIQHRFGARGGPAELEELAASLDGLLERVAAVVRHEQQLSAELSHELRTPLARITGEVELLSARSRTAAERRQALSRISESAATMSTTLETLLDVARANVTRSPGRCDVAEALNAFAGAGLTVEVQEGLHSGVDLAMLQRMLQPLVDNARRFAASRVAIEARAGEGGVVITVEDDGPGVARELQESIFEPGVTGSDHGGAGLGLALARRLARATGGDIVLSSPKPAVFEIRVPAA
jgi:signal transduction histidine kinase